MYAYHSKQTDRSTRLHHTKLTERLRCVIALAFTGLALGWLLFGVIALAMQGNFSILISVIALAYPMYQIIYYYFGKPEGRNR